MGDNSEDCVPMWGKVSTIDTFDNLVNYNMSITDIHIKRWESIQTCYNNLFVL